MQGAYVTSQHLEGEGVANNYTMENYVHCYKKVRMTHTQTQNCTEGKTLCQVQHYIYMYVYMSASSAKHFVYNSCLFLACNLAVGRKVKVSKL